jgi:hypothetical protein
MHELQILGYIARKRFCCVKDSSSAEDATAPLHYGGLTLNLAALEVVYISTGTIIKSGEFQVGGYTWDLVYTFGDEGYRDLRSITLELLGTNIDVDVIAMASLRIDDPLGQGSPAVWRSDASNTFSKGFHRRS